MLKHLSITNYVIIENLELKINGGFTVITGETGAGKSILLGALSLILGQRADVSVLNNKDKKCIIEGEFELDKNQYLSFFEKNELDYEPQTLIRREINSKGKSRAFINDTPVSLSVLKTLTSKLIDLHSQHQTLQIQDNKFQLSVLDAFSQTDLTTYKKKFEEYTTLKLELKTLIELANQSKANVDYITFQANEIEDLHLKPDEKEKIEAELELKNNAEEIKHVLLSSSDALINSEENLIAQLKNITNSYYKIINCSSAYNSIYERLNSMVIELEDLSNEIESSNNNLDFDPTNLQFLNDRISKIYAIEEKHNVSSTQEILILLADLKQQLAQTNSYQDRIDVLTKELNKNEKELYNLAKTISKKRVKSFTNLSKEITKNLSLLGMQNSSFIVNHSILDQLNENGIDGIDFMFSANKGVEAQEIKKAASGGELSRLMLTIKSILANGNKLSSIIFDEIDTGVSGEVADKMAVIMKNMSNKMQVISITHLPQVAAKGDYHYKIFKESKKDKTLTNVITLDKETRVEELAKMLSGKKMSEAAISNAKALLNQ
ncbi:MAG: DNA repair protein RecN [Vicingaceae bacterium]